MHCYDKSDAILTSTSWIKVRLPRENEDKKDIEKSNIAEKFKVILIQNPAISGVSLYQGNDPEVRSWCTFR